MKHRAFRAALIALAALPAFAHAWSITDFATDITIEPTGTMLVEEAISVDFLTEERHGIYRDLPIAYAGEAGEMYAPISDITVSSETAPDTTDVTYEADWVRIRIGDPDETVSGTHTYRITYRVTGVLRSFPGYDELYWNVTGNGWDVPIARASARVRAPAAFIQSACYRGADGATDPCAFEEDAAFPFTTTDLAPYEGLTVAVALPSGTVPIILATRPPTLADAPATPIALVAFIIGSAIGIVAVLRIWWRFGRDRFLQRAPLPGVRSTDRESAQESIVPLFRPAIVSVEYDAPDSLRPAEIGVLLDEKADTRDVSATIVDLASRGYLEITEIPKSWLFGSTDYSFTRTAKPATDLLAFESLLLDKLFGNATEIALSELKNTFYTKLPDVKSALYDEAITKGLFASHPEKTRAYAYGAGAITIALGTAGLFGASNWILLSGALTLGNLILTGLAFSLIVTGIIALCFAPYMPRKTGLGRELYQRALGYRDFVSGTEKYRSRFAEDTGLFTAVLPYAVMFGVTHKLAEAFKEMGIEPEQPRWYHASRPWNAALFVDEMGSFSKSLSTAIASAPSGSGSGGSGFSGGGFGGGGGGAW